MAKTAVIFNGIKLNTRVLERSVDRAIHTSGTLIVLCLRSSGSEDEDYAYPGSHEQPVTLVRNSNVLHREEAMLATNIEIIQFRAMASNLNCRTVTMIEPSASELESILRQCDAVFIDTLYESPVTLGASVSPIRQYIDDNRSKMQFVVK